MDEWSLKSIHPHINLLVHNIYLFIFGRNHKSEHGFIGNFQNPFVHSHFNMSLEECYRNYEKGSRNADKKDQAYLLGLCVVLLLDSRLILQLAPKNPNDLHLIKASRKFGFVDNVKIQFMNTL